MAGTCMPRNKRVVGQIAPAVRVAIGEEFGIRSRQKYDRQRSTPLCACLVLTRYSTPSFSADLTVIEEANELLYKLENGEQKYPQGNSLAAISLPAVRLGYVS